MILSNELNNNKILNNANYIEQYSSEKQQDVLKLRINFTLKNLEQNRFLFVMNLLLLERASSQRVVFIKENTNFAKVAPLKVGCTVTLRKNVLLNFMKMFVLYSFPKIHQEIINSNNKVNKYKLLSINFDKFLFIAMFSYFTDFDRFLVHYENLIYNFHFELYTGSHKFLLNRLIYSLYGLQTL
jgi:hypothetical protein